MKHGVAFRKLSRPTAHRILMLRNMVSSLIEHEQIQTTVAKAKEAARLAEKLITLGKKGNESHRRSAQSILISPELLPKVFKELADRYRNRPGGYTRIYKYGHRPGDNAPKAVLELVDGPRDTKFEMVARRVGWEVMEWKARGEHTGLYRGIERGVESIDFRGGNASYLNENTRAQIAKVFRFRPRAHRAEFGEKAAQHLNKLMVESIAKESSEMERREQHLKEKKDQTTNAHVRHQNRRIWEFVWNREPGQIVPGSDINSIQLSRGVHTRKRPWQLERPTSQRKHLQISANRRYSPPKIIRVKTVEVTTDKKDKRTSRVVIEEGQSLKDMPFRQRALPPKVQSALSI